MFRHIRLLPLLLLTVLLTGCVTTHRVTDDQRTIPDRDLTRGLPDCGQRVTNGPVRFDALYVATITPAGGSSHHVWYRFWPNGRVLKRASTTGTPTAADGDSFVGGHVGRFAVCDGEIVMNVYGQGDAGWVLHTEYARMQGDDLLIHAWKSPMRLGTIELNRLAQRVDVRGMTRRPDW